MKKSLCFILALLACSTTLCGRADAAQFSIAGGGLVTDTPSAAGAAVLVSTSAPVPTLPLQLQATLLVPIIKQGGYAVTGEVRGLSGGGFGGAYIGAGAGVGSLSVDRETGPVVTLFVGKPIASSTTVELRAYRGTRSNGTTAGFLGLRFTL